MIRYGHSHSNHVKWKRAQLLLFPFGPLFSCSVQDGVCALGKAHKWCASRRLSELFTTMRLKQFHCPSRQKQVRPLFSSVQDGICALGKAHKWCASRRLSELFTTMRLKQFHCPSDWRWASLVLSRQKQVRPLTINQGYKMIYLLRMLLLCCLMSSDVGWHIRDKLRPMPKHGSI